MKKSYQNSLFFILAFIATILISISLWFLFNFQTKSKIELSVQKNELGFFTYSPKISEGVQYNGIIKDVTSVEKIELYAIKTDENLYKLKFLNSLSTNKDNFIISIDLQNVNFWKWMMKFLHFNP